MRTAAGLTVAAILAATAGFYFNLDLGSGSKLAGGFFIGVDCVALVAIAVLAFAYPKIRDMPEE
jgi:hypothetical protein